MHPALKTLVSGLESEEREAVIRRYYAMDAELRYLIDTKPADVAMATRIGWPPQRLQVVFSLNSFYQRILAPLWASAISPSVIGVDIPIRYGRTILFDRKRNAKINEMGMQFEKLCNRFSITRDMLEAQRTSDLIWKINHHDGQDEAG